MKTWILGLAVALTLPSGAEELSLAQPSEKTSKAWGVPANGLQMSVSHLTVESNGKVSFRISCKNCGTEDVLLNLGYRYGSYLVPNRVRLKLIDSKKATKELDHFDRRFSVVAGRIDEFIVSLPIGAIYTLRQSLNDYYCSKTGEFGLKPGPGKYWLSADFEGRGSIGTIRDAPCNISWDFWKGKVVSNISEFVVPKAKQ